MFAEYLTHATETLMKTPDKLLTLFGTNLIVFNELNLALSHNLLERERERERERENILTRVNL